jgi:hypothetical protein
VAIVAHGLTEDVLYENNLFDFSASIPNTNSNQCWAIQAGCGYDLTSFPYAQTGNLPVCQSLRTVARRNRIIGAGQQAINFQSCVNCTFESNVMGPFKGYAAGQEEGSAIVWSSKRNSTDPASSGVIVRSNTVYDNSKQGTNGAFQLREGSASGELPAAPNSFVLVSNTVYKPSGATNNACFNLGTSTNVFGTVDNNHCYRVDGAPSWGTVPAGKNADGTAFDAHSLKGNLNPVFANPAGGDFTPPPGSPLAGAGSASLSSTIAVGSPSWSAADTGKTRASPPEIGAFAR